MTSFPSREARTVWSPRREAREAGLTARMTTLAEAMPAGLSFWRIVKESGVCGGRVDFIREAASEVRTQAMKLMNGCDWTLDGFEEGVDAEGGDREEEGGRERRPLKIAVPIFPSEILVART